MALYHRHRPQTFADIVGQTHVTQTLSNQVTHDKTAHAYLFSGPRGVGKTTIARILAKSLNCKNKKNNSSEPCNTCQSCEEISKTHSIDVIEIDAASYTGVDNVRTNIIDNAQFKPTSSKHKIFIIDEVHMLSTAAFNALLKTLEEPPAYVVFILATTDPQKLPATIISRCQRFNFSKVPDEDMRKQLKKIGKIEGITIEDDVLSRIIRKSEGCARDAISLLDQLMATGEKKITADAASLILPSTNIETQLDFTTHLIHKNTQDALTTIQTLVSEGHSLPHFAQDLTEFLRIIMIAQVDLDLAAKEMDLTKDSIKKIKELIPHISPRDIVKLIDLTMHRSSEIKRAPLPQLPLEMLVIEWCGNSVQGNEGSVASTPEVKTEGQKMSDEITSVKTGHAPSPSVEKNTTQSPQKSIKEPIVEKITEDIQKVEIETSSDLPDSPITKQDVENKWQDCIASLDNEYPSIIYVLKNAHIPDVSDNIITLEVSHAFHAEKISEKDKLSGIEKLFGKTLNARIKINVTVAQDDAQKSKPTAKLQDLAAALGGEVVS